MRRRRAAFALAVLAASSAFGAPGGGAEPLAPFFDDLRQGPVDATPPPPVLDAFDRAVLDLCGDWGAPVAEQGFRTLLERFPGRRRAILEAAGLDDAAALAALWFGKGAFRHVFCGAPEGGKLGGLHWVGRYLQAQDKGWAGPMTAAACRRREIAPPVYTLGLWYRRLDGTLGRKCPGGYASSQGAADILAAVSAAAVTVNAPGRTVCLGRGRHPAGVFPMVVVVEDGALVTAYPDVSPPDTPACGE
jgi:hypothetical protein